MVTGASLRPSAISGSGPGCMISAIEGFSMTSRRPTEAVVGVSLKGLEAATAGVARDPWSPAIPSPIEMLPSVVASPVHPASATATNHADSVWRPGNAPLVSALEDRLERLLEIGEAYPAELLAVDE